MYIIYYNILYVHYRFYLPHGITIDKDDNIWLTDVALHQVVLISYTIYALYYYYILYITTICYIQIL